MLPVVCDDSYVNHTSAAVRVELQRH